MTGIYKSKIEVMFDEPFIGANSLCGRCYFFRGAVVNILEIFNLSEWKPYVNMKKDIADKIAKKEQVAEWDGKLDGFLLMDQIVKIKKEYIQDDFGVSDDQLTKAHVKEFSRRYYKNDGGKDGGRGKRRSDNRGRKEKDDRGDSAWFEDDDHEKEMRADEPGKKPAEGGMDLE